MFWESKEALLFSRCYHLENVEEIGHKSIILHLVPNINAGRLQVVLVWEKLLLTSRYLDRQACGTDSVEDDDENIGHWSLLMLHIASLDSLWDG